MDPSSRQEMRELHADLQSGMISQADYDDLKSIVITRIKAKAPEFSEFHEIPTIISLDSATISLIIMEFPSLRFLNMTFQFPLTK